MYTINILHKIYNTKRKYDPFLQIKSELCNAALEPWRVKAS